MYVQSGMCREAGPRGWTEGHVHTRGTGEKLGTGRPVMHRGGQGHDTHLQPSSATRPLLGLSTTDAGGDQALHPQLRAVGPDFDKARVHDVYNAVDGDGGLGHICADHDLALALGCRVEHAHLLGAAEARVQRQREEQLVPGQTLPGLQMRGWCLGACTRPRTL